MGNGRGRGGGLGVGGGGVLGGRAHGERGRILGEEGRIPVHIVRGGHHGDHRGVTRAGDVVQNGSNNRDKLHLGG